MLMLIDTREVWRAPGPVSYDSAVARMLSEDAPAATTCTFTSYPISSLHKYFTKASSCTSSSHHCQVTLSGFTNQASFSSCIASLLLALHHTNLAEVWTSRNLDQKTPGGAVELEGRTSSYRRRRLALLCLVFPAGPFC